MLVMGREGNEEAGRRSRSTLRRRAANGAQPVSARRQRKGPLRTGAATLEVLPTIPRPEPHPRGLKTCVPVPAALGAQGSQQHGR